MSADRREASHYRHDEGRFVCGLCPHGCRIAVGSRGRCGSRLGDRDVLVADNYGKVATMHIDPMEKKPLYHFHPGEEVLSVGGWGCNMGCLHCQNHSLSTVRDGEGRHRFISPEELVSLCSAERVGNLAFTYNEPTIWHEYIMDVAELLQDVTLTYVSNGYISPEPRKEVAERIDAMNLDVKAFTDAFYRQVAKATLEPVLETAEAMIGAGVHLELTYLLIPGKNDSSDELKDFCVWARSSLGEDVPLHFSAYHRDHLMREGRDTSAEDLLRARHTAVREGLLYVYLGNLPLAEGRETVCPSCGAVAVRRRGYSVDTSGLDQGCCASCGRTLNMRV